MKRTVIAAFLALSSASLFAANTQYKNDAGEQDLHQPQVAANDEYRNDAGEQDEHQPQVADAGDKSGNHDQNYPQLG